MLLVALKCCSLRMLASYSCKLCTMTSRLEDNSPCSIHHIYGCWYYFLPVYQQLHKQYYLLGIKKFLTLHAFSAQEHVEGSDRLSVCLTSNIVNAHCNLHDIICIKYLVFKYFFDLCVPSLSLLSVTSITVRGY